MGLGGCLVGKKEVKYIERRDAHLPFTFKLHDLRLDGHVSRLVAHVP